MLDRYGQTIEILREHSVVPVSRFTYQLTISIFAISAPHCSLETISQSKLEQIVVYLGCTIILPLVLSNLQRSNDYRSYDNFLTTYII